VMLVDVVLPPDLGGALLCDGFQVAQWLQHTSAKKIPSIIISGSDKAAYKCQAEKMGADAFLAKPLDKETLIESIESALANPAPVLEGAAPLKMAVGSGE